MLWSQVTRRKDCSSSYHNIWVRIAAKNLLASCSTGVNSRVVLATPHTVLLAFLSQVNVPGCLKNLFFLSTRSHWRLKSQLYGVWNSPKKVSLASYVYSKTTNLFYVKVHCLANLWSKQITTFIFYILKDSYRFLSNSDVWYLLWLFFGLGQIVEVRTISVSWVGFETLADVKKEKGWQF